MLVDPRVNNGHAISALFEATGNGVVSKFEITGYRTMTLDEFKSEVVPTLKSSDAEKDFSYYILRDLSQDRYITLYPDGAVEYKVSSIAETTASNFIDYLKSLGNSEDTMTTQIINSPFPVLSYAQRGDIWQMQVKTPETKFRYRHPGLFNNSEEAPLVYMPPLAFQVKYAGQIYKSSSVKVIVEDSLDPAKIKFGKLSFPNIFADNSICMGSTHVAVSSNGDLTKAQLFMQSWDLFLNGKHNDDLLELESFPHNLEEIFRKYATDVQRAAISKDGPRHAALKKLLLVLSEPGRWEELEWRHI